jgi:hypothetical protein
MSIESVKALVKNAMHSGQSEGQLLADFIQDALDEGEGTEMVAAMMDEIIEWAGRFKSAAEGGGKRRQAPRVGGSDRVKRIRGLARGL